MIIISKSNEMVIIIWDWPFLDFCPFSNNIS